MAKFLLFLLLSLSSYQLSAKGADITQHFIENVSSYLEQKTYAKRTEGYLQQGLTQGEVKELKRDISIGLAQCLLYSLLALPKNVGQTMIFDIAGGMSIAEAKAKSEKIWMSFAKKEIIFEQVERSQAITEVCGKDVKSRFKLKYNISI